MIETLKEEEDKARMAHSYIWEYGDPGFDDDEERESKGGNKKAAAATKPVVKGKQ